MAEKMHSNIFQQLRNGSLIGYMNRSLFGVTTRLFGACDVNDTVVVAGAPRSGTTWLAELLRELPGRYKLLNEPLQLDWNPRAEEVGFNWRTRISPGEDRPELAGYIADALEGKIDYGPSWHFRNDHPLREIYEHATHRQLVVKFCRAGRMLHWLSEKSDVRGIVLIIRHPCAVIASRLNTEVEAWQPRNVSSISIRDRFGNEAPEHILQDLQELPQAVDSWVGHLAVQWSLDYYFSFYQHSRTTENYPWVLTSYERLFVEREKELSRVVNALGGSVTQKMRTQISNASEFSADDFQFDAQHQLTKWREELTEDQIETILRVADAFGMGFYTDKAVPDFEQLNQFQLRGHAHQL